MEESAITKRKLGPIKWEMSTSLVPNTVWKRLLFFGVITFVYGGGLGGWDVVCMCMFVGSGDTSGVQTCAQKY